MRPIDESWDGTIDTNVKIVSNVDNDDMAEEVVEEALQWAPPQESLCLI